MENEKACKDLVNVIKELYPGMTEYQQEKLQGVWPELTESEDEKWVKWLIGHLKGYINQTDERYAEVCKKAISWLEKQDKQKSVEEVNGDDRGIDGIWHAERILEKTLGKVEGYQSDDGIIEHNAAIAAIKKLKEEKSKVHATLREELENEWNKCCPEDEGMGLEIAHVEHNQFDEIAMRFYEMGLERKSIKWSDEDESMYTRCIGILGKCYMKELPQNVEEELDWLKSLKNRVLPQQKQEWSEEDEKMWLQVINEIEAIKSNSSTVFEKNIAQDKIDWLKSLKPKSKQEWSEDDKKITRDIIRMLDKVILYYKNKENNSEMAKDALITVIEKQKDWLQSIKPESKQEWSEEDEKMIEDCIGAVAAADYYPYEDKQKMEKWLESLKDRMQPKPVEWSEEDEKKLNGICMYIMCSDSPEGYTEWIDFLKSLKERYTWKPSEEQMKRLLCAIRILKGVNEHTDAKYLEELFDDLKKL